MKITFDKWNQNPAVDKATTLYEASTVAKGQQTFGAYALDISGPVMDNNAYGDHGRSTKDVMQSFDAQLDLSVQRDYMTVMSNILSTEDFNKMMEGGFDPSKLDPQQVVTIVDHIKATMAQSGQVVAGYNDNLDTQQLTEIVGDAGLAKEIEDALKGSNLPVNEENVAALYEALNKAEGVGRFDEAGKKYMVENHLDPTVENMYRASFSALGDGSRQSRGYYAQEMSGYFAKKADNIDWNVMQPQLEKAISGMDLKEQTTEKSLGQAKWLVEKGIPVTRETMCALGGVESLAIPLDRKTVIGAGINALLEGKNASEGLLTASAETIYEEAARYVEEANAITDEAVKETLVQGKDITLQNLYAAQIQMNAAVDMLTSQNSFAGKTTAAMQVSASIEIHFSEEKYISATRQLAEVQLRMTVDANIKLLKSDYAIDTAPLADLVEALKQQEQKLAASFFGEENSEGITDKTGLFTDTQNVLRELPFLPAAVVGKIRYAQELSLSVVHKEGVALQTQYEKAGASYEALMTTPRADMGDSIQKAFRNVDVILQDMELELSEDNRKAVRILGYNNMEVTQESVVEIKDRYLQLENVIKSVTPQRTLSMIREGVNPLTMELSELEAYLNKLDRTAEEEMTKYSRYLYELEKSGQITDSEREAYVGIYRLFHQIEKSDGAVIGSLMEQGADLTLGNLLTAVRNKKAGKMDYIVDDSFGGLTDRVEKGKSISGQIEKGVTEARMAHSIFRDLSVEVLQQLPISDDTTLEQLRNAFVQADGQELFEEVARETLRRYREDCNLAKEADDAIFGIMKQQGITFTVENLLATNTLLTEKGSFVKGVWDTAKKLGRQNSKTDYEEALSDAEKDIVDNFTDYESAQKALENWEKIVEETMDAAISEIDYSGNDVRSMYMNYKQLSIMGSMRKNESYVIPMEINGERTSVNLMLMHNSEEKGTVTITMNTETIGKTGVKFWVSGNRVESYFVADSEMGKEKLRMAGESILRNLQKEGMEIGDVHYVNAHAQGRKEWNLLTFSSRNVDNTSEAVATSQLYGIAKIFLVGMQKLT